MRSGRAGSTGNLLRLAGLGALTLAALVLGGYLALDRLAATEVLYIAPKPDDVVRVERGLWEPGQPVAEIYGTPASSTVRVVRPDPERLLRPAEDSSLLLLKVDRQRGDSPLQVKTVWFLAARLALGLGLFAGLAWPGGWWLGRRARTRARDAFVGDPI